MLPIHNSVEDMQVRGSAILPAMLAALSACITDMLKVEAAVSNDGVAQVETVGNILRELQQHVHTCKELPPQVAPLLTPCAASAGCTASGGTCMCTSRRGP